MSAGLRSGVDVVRVTSCSKPVSSRSISGGRGCTVPQPLAQGPSDHLRGTPVKLPRTAGWGNAGRRRGVAADVVERATPGPPSRWHAHWTQRRSTAGCTVDGHITMVHGRLVPPWRCGSHPRRSNARLGMGHAGHRRRRSTARRRWSRSRRPHSDPLEPSAICLRFTSTARRRPWSCRGHDSTRPEQVACGVGTGDERAPTCLPGDGTTTRLRHIYWPVRGG